MRSVPRSPSREKERPGFEPGKMRVNKAARLEFTQIMHFSTDYFRSVIRKLPAARQLWTFGQVQGQPLLTAVGALVTGEPLPAFRMADDGNDFVVNVVTEDVLYETAYRIQYLFHGISPCERQDAAGSLIGGEE